MTSFSTLTRSLSRGLSRRHALRSVCLAATVVAGLAPATGALAQTASYPNKPVRIIVGFPAGTGPDIVARLLAQKLSEGWGNLGVIVDNKPGAGDLIAATEAARAAPDGYTLMLGETGQLSIAPSSYNKLPYDPQKDFAPVSQVVTADFALLVNPQKVPSRKCEGLCGLDLATIGPVPGHLWRGHCKVTGAINPRVGVDGKNYAIGFQLSLPDRWNGRFLFIGGGGNDGILRDTSLSSSISGGTPSPLGQGFAVVSTDAGHTGTSASFGADPQARTDHAYNSYDKTAVASKSLIRTRYGRKPDYSYFSGCSGGGRQGMMFSQRFPDYFDGITAGAPAMRVSSGATVAAMWNTIQFNAIAPQDASGNRILSKAFSNSDLKLVANAVNATCDAADGVVDGLAQNDNACKAFDPAVLQCTGGKTDSCLSSAQVGALKSVFAGPRNSVGKALYTGQPWDGGLAAPGWRSWTLGNSTTATPDARYITLMVDALVNGFFTPPDLSFNPLAFNFDTDPARMAAYSAIYDTYADDKLVAYKQRGGKLLFIHGMSDDPIFSAFDTVDYYERLAANNGGVAATQSFARTFLVPGMNHCSGGPATDNFDSIQTMVDWVEKGIAPQNIAAKALPTNTDFPNRTRPLCPYPQFAKYKGSGSVEDASSFVCSAS